MTDPATLLTAATALGSSLMRWKAPVLVPVAPLAAAALLVVFAAAAAAKTRRSAAPEFGRLGLPAARILAVAVPTAEWATVALLVARPRWGAVAAIGLLVPFTAVLLRALRQPGSVSCGCFGARSNRPVTPATIGRNLALVAVAVVAMVNARWMAPSPAAAAAVGAVALLAAVGVQLAALRSTVGHLWSVELAGEPIPATVPASTRPSSRSVPAPGGNQS
ncbi:MAG: MauE/DoxX family redox-associated membrane protein [Actinomycetota bacterium]